MARINYDPDLMKMKHQLYVMRQVAREYSGRTIDNIIRNYEARIEHIESNNETTED